MPYTKGKKRREQALQTARILFATKGYSNVSMADIALECDIARTTLYDYFPTKEDILIELLNEVTTGARSTEAVGRTTYERLCYLVCDSLRRVQENRLIYRIVFQESSELTAVAGERMKQMTDNWGNHIRRVLLEDAEQVEPSITADDVVLAYQSLVQTWGRLIVFSDEDVDVAAVSRKVVSILWFGVGKRANSNDSLSELE